MKKVKVVAVGDEHAGKTQLFMAMAGREFSEVYVPTVFENYDMTLTVNGKKFAIVLWDTAGNEEYDRLRPLSYPDTDVVLFCFSVDNHKSLENIILKWHLEAKHFCPKASYLLIGTKKDVRQNSSDATFPEEGLLVARKINAWSYIECSASTREGVEEVAMKAALAASGKLKKQGV